MSHSWLDSLSPKRSGPAKPNLLEVRWELAFRTFEYFVAWAWDLVEPGIRFVRNWHISQICAHLEAIADGRIRNLLINIPPGHMKLCADSTPVLTPDGWRLHGDLAVGDRVFGPDGKPRTIIRTSRRARADYRVEFVNGEVVECNGDHLWTIYDRPGRLWRTLPTSDLARRALWSGDRASFQLPDVAALQFQEQVLPLPPYFLGAWLGDGTSTKPCITHDPLDEAIISRIAACGIRPTQRYGPYPRVSAMQTMLTHQGVIERLGVLGVYGKKRIPEVYKRSSIAQRLELMAGLIDTDGSADKGRGRYRISTASSELAHDISDVATSLGWRPYITTFQPPGYGEYKSANEAHYHVCMSPTMDVPVALDRKRLTARALRRRIGIKAIRKVSDPELGRCITIDHPDGLYLVGRSCIPTHNSLLVCVFFPAWMWLRRPGWRALFASYAEALALRDSVKCRAVVLSDAYQAMVQSDWYRRRVGPSWKLSGDQNVKHYFTTTATGYRMALGVGGMATGFRGDCIVVDDPLNAKEQLSAQVRKSCLFWWDQAYANRLNDLQKGARIVIMQRLHEEDLSGHLIEQSGAAVDPAGRWDQLILPTRFVADKAAKTSLGLADPRTEPNQLLFPERFPAPVIAEEELRLTEVGFAGQHQQSPVPEGGALFKTDMIEIIDELPVGISRRVRWWDAAGTPGAGDWTVGVLMGKTSDGRFIIIDVERGQWLSDVVDRMMLQTAKTDGVGVEIGEEQEGGSSGKAVINSHVKLLAGFTFKGVAPSGDKVTRAKPFATQVNAGNVKIYRNKATGSPWIRQYLSELKLFPFGKNDDQVDASSAGFNELALGAAEPYRLRVVGL